MTKKRIYHVIWLMTFLIGFSHLQGQTLKRQASLGIAMKQLPDSLKKEYNLPLDRGVYLANIAPQATASNIGIEPGSLLLSLNGIAVNSSRDVLAISKTLKEGETVEMTYLFEGQEYTKTGTATPRHKEEYEGAEVEYGQVMYANNQLRSILYRPMNVQHPPVIYFLQGYTCGSIDFVSYPDYSLKKLINDWVDEGFAVYRVEKPGVGDSDCDQGCDQIDFKEELTAFMEGYKTLKNNLAIDTSNIFLFGHSMGGIIAPLLAKDFQPRGVITYGTFINSWFEYMIELPRSQGYFFNQAPQDIEAQVRNTIPFMYNMLVAKKSVENILNDEHCQRYIENNGLLESFKAGQYLNRHISFWQTLNDVQPVKAWLQVKSHVLALHGEFDIQALNAQAAMAIAQTVNSNNPGKATFQLIEQADHSFVRFNSMDENIQALTNQTYYSYSKNNYHDGVAKATIEWIKANLNL